MSLVLSKEARKTHMLPGTRQGSSMLRILNPSSRASRIQLRSDARVTHRGQARCPAARASAAASTWQVPDGAELDGAAGLGDALRHILHLRRVEDEHLPPRRAAGTGARGRGAETEAPRTGQQSAARPPSGHGAQAARYTVAHARRVAAHWQTLGTSRSLSENNDAMALALLLSPRRRLADGD